jgi:hypothetical protein
VVAFALPRRTAQRPRGLSTASYEAHARRRVFWYATAALLSAVGLSYAVVQWGVAVVVLPVAVAALAAIAWRPKAGLYLVLLLVLLFEMASPDPLMEPGRYIHFGLQSSLGISGFIFSPVELLMIFTAAIWLIHGLVTRRLDYRGGDLGWPMALFFLSLVGGLLRGAAGAGDMYIAFWEVRSLLYFGGCYLLTANLIRTKRDVGALLTIMLIGNGLYAAEGAFRYVALIRTEALGVADEFNYSHEVVIFLSVLILQALVQFVVGGSVWRRACGLLLAPLAMFTLLGTQRRAGYIALAIAFVPMALPWVVRHRKAVFLLLLPGLIGAAIYLPIFWNNTGFLGQPARAVKSLIAPDARDASSNEYRDLEKINVKATIRSDPLLGVGFGRPFLFVVPLPDLSWWPFWHYQPHHNFLWVWLKVGAPGFMLFCLMMFSALALAGARVLTLADRTLTAFACVAIAAIVTSLVFCYVDLALTNGRVTIFLGSIIGVLSVLRQIDQPDPVPAPVQRRPLIWSRYGMSDDEEGEADDERVDGQGAWRGDEAEPEPDTQPDVREPATAGPPVGAGRG